MSNENWHDIKRQIEEQVAAFELMNKIGIKAYHKINKTRFRSFRNIKYVPLDGVSVESFWASADAQIESGIKKNLSNSEA